MSYVSTVVIASDYLSGEDKQYINEAIETRARGGSHFVEPSHCDVEVWGGTKCCEAHLLLGAFNHMDVNAFVEALMERHFNGGIYVLIFTEGYTTTYSQDHSREWGEPVTHYGSNGPKGRL